MLDLGEEEVDEADGGGLGEGGQVVFDVLLEDGPDEAVAAVLRAFEEDLQEFEGLHGADLGGEEREGGEFGG